MDCYFLCSVFVLVSVATGATAQQPCMDSGNKRGTCELISNCPHLSKLVETEPVPQETIQFLERLQCGIIGLEPQVCCVPPKEAAGQLQDDCRTPNGTEGTCVPIRNCTQYYAVIMDGSRTEADEEYIRRSRCTGESGTIRICCPKTATVDTVSRSSDTCRTPLGQQGRCVVLNLCRSLDTIAKNKPISKENVKLLLGSQCGQESKQPKVCCPMTDQSLVQPVPTLGEKMDVIKGKEPVKLTPKLPELMPTSPKLPELRPTSPKPPELMPTSLELAPLPEGEDCGKQVIISKIRNGEKTGIYDFPWMALLQYNRTNDYQCGGVLISKRYVMTAAHCVSGTRLENRYGTVKTVRLGEHNLRTDPDCFMPYPNIQECNYTPQDIPVEEIVVHDGWIKDDKALNNDVALLRLSHEANVTEFVRPICLARQESDIVVGRDVTAAGWGTTELDLVNFNEEKLKIRIPVADKTSCSESYLRRNVSILLHDGQFCAGGGNSKQNVCNGDSGGPIMQYNRKDGSWYSVGIISAGVLNCRVIGLPSIFTNVPYYSQWIASKLRV